MESKIIYSSEEEAPKPKRTRKPLSDEQREALRERLSKAREAKKAKRESKKDESPSVTLNMEPSPEPEPMPEPEPQSNEPLVKESLTKPSLTKASKPLEKVLTKEMRDKKVKEETPPKPKRKYVRKPKAIITQAFNPF